MVLIDSDFLIGFFNKRDIHYERCQTIYPKIPNRILIAWDVIDEVVTKLCYFDKKETAFEFIKLVNKDHVLVEIPNNTNFVLAQTILKRQTTKNISLTDCMNMVIAKEKNIQYILSFDKIYEKNGFRLFK